MYTEASTHSLPAFQALKPLTTDDLTIYGDISSDMTNSVFPQVTLSQVPVERSQPESEVPSSGSVDPAWFVVPVAICGTMAWSAIAKMIQNRKIKAKEQESSICPTIRQIPCQQCRYFSPNGYLNCAIRPSHVLTQEAIDCSDYDPPEHKY